MQEYEYTDLKRCDECAEMTGIKDKIYSLPKGMASNMLRIIEEDGLELSGGQKQKLALARALYKDAPVVILDEPTSALDPLAEYEQYMSFDRMVGQKTAVYISHRLASTRFCDVIAMFQKGTLIEYGTHSDLIEKSGPYAEMYEMQSNYYKEEVVIL